MDFWCIKHGVGNEGLPLWAEKEINFCLANNIVVIGGDELDLFSI